MASPFLFNLVNSELFPLAAPRLLSLPSDCSQPRRPSMPVTAEGGA